VVTHATRPRQRCVAPRRGPRIAQRACAAPPFPTAQELFV
jgi:hypothetical protein